ncbi:MAG TPA: hypothetical protein VM888_13435 [Chitinophagaceae bacterium]|nr:hypothetical protein [Chitinophagaceae bacterium]
MKKTTGLVFFLAALSLLSGVLLSKATLIGRVGINLFYQEYKFLKVWWQGAFVIFTALMLLLLVHLIVQKLLDYKTAKFTYILALAVALVGMYLTYKDFRESLSHRLLGERFHIGAYLFWLGWICINMFFLVLQKQVNNKVTSITE